jgi:restriction endonuclease Mrr
VFFWQTGNEASLVAVGRVTSPRYERDESDFGRFCVDVVFEHKVVPPLTRVRVRENTILARFRPFTKAQGTNFRINDPDVVAELDNVLRKNLVPIRSHDQAESSDGDLQKSREADNAIKRANKNVEEKLQRYIAQMDPIAFEWLARALFLKLKYKNVMVTKPSGDRGIDINAILDAGGVANIKTCIQVKRQPSVGRPVVQNLRGSLSAHEAGLLVTSGYFTAEAIEEAKVETRVPITLINRDKLIALLLEYGIGVKRNKVTLYSLDLDDLSKEKLEALVEVSNESNSDVE